MSDKGELTGHFALVYPSKYIKAADLMGQNVTVTILRVRKETIEMEGGKKDDKAVLYIADARGKALQKTWVAGKTVLKQIAATLGDPAIGAWKGKQVTIYPTTCKSKGGETVECIRVRPRLMQGAHDMPADMTAGDDEGPPAEKPRPAEPPAARILAALTAAQDLAAVDAATLDFDAACKAQQIRKSEGQQIRLVIAARREALTQPGQQATNDTGTQESETA
jgi:hypothetical protein